MFFHIFVLCMVSGFCMVSVWFLYGFIWFHALRIFAVWTPEKPSLVLWEQWEQPPFPWRKSRCVFQCDIDMLFDVVCFLLEHWKSMIMINITLENIIIMIWCVLRFSTSKSVPTFIFQPYFSHRSCIGRPPCFIQVPKVNNNPFPLILNTPLEIMVYPLVI